MTGARLVHDVLGRALGVGGCGAGALSSVPHTESLFDSRLTEILRRFYLHLVDD